MNPLVSSMRTVTKVVRSESSSLRESSNSEENLDSMQTSSGIPLYVSFFSTYNMNKTFLTFTF
jgi:hypothetical protein